MNLPLSNQKTKTFKVGLYIRLSREDGDKEESSSITNQREIMMSAPVCDRMRERILRASPVLTIFCWIRERRSCAIPHTSMFTIRIPRFRKCRD